MHVAIVSTESLTMPTGEVPTTTWMQQHQSGAGVGVDMLRSDIARAIGEVPPSIRDQITGACAPCLELVNAHLAEDEPVNQLSSAAPSWLNAPINSLLVLTSRRLIFVAPAPQVIGWNLTALTKVQALNGAPGRVAGFHVHADGGEFQLGVDGGWGQAFERSVKQAAAVAVLANQ